MSETFAETKASIRRLKALLSDADETTRWMFGFWLAGIALMGGTIVAEFGWRGTAFCFGLILWKAADKASEK